MKKNLFLLIAFIGALFVMSSCVQDEPEVPTLTLSAMSHDFPREASEQSFTVTTNQSEWYAMANAEWVELSQSGNTLSVKVLENANTESRKSDILVSAGGVGRKIQVTQAGSEVSIVTFPEKLTVDQWGGDYQFYVDANTQDWTITSDADWLELQAMPFRGEVRMTINENVEREDRVAKLTLVGNGDKGAKEFIVTQSGILYDILPFLLFGEHFEKTEALELQRRSEVISEPSAGLPSWGIPDDLLYNVATKSKVVPNVYYEVASLDDHRVVSATTQSEPASVFDSESYKNKLKDLGFVSVDKTMAGESYIEYFENKETKVQLELIVDKSKDIAQSTFSPIIEQDKAYPTFKTLPYGLIEFGEADVARVADYEANEATPKGTFLEESVQEDEYGKYVFQSYQVNKDGLLTRNYFIGTEGEYAALKLMETSQLYEDKNLIFFTGSDGKDYITNEFKKLLADEGFVYLGESATGGIFYANASKGLQVFFRWVHYTEYDNPTLDLRFSEYTPDDAQKAISNSIIKTQKGKFNKNIKWNSAKTIFFNK